MVHLHVWVTLESRSQIVECQLSPYNQINPLKLDLAIYKRIFCKNPLKFKSGSAIQEYVRYTRYVFKYAIICLFLFCFTLYYITLIRIFICLLNLDRSTFLLRAFRHDLYSEE